MNQKVYTRQYYIDKIRGFYHSDLIKVVTGIRRCGKSFFLLSVMEDLKKSGVNEKDIMLLPCCVKEYNAINASGSTSISTAQIMYGSANCENRFIQIPPWTLHEYPQGRMSVRPPDLLPNNPLYES